MIVNQAVARLLRWRMFYPSVGVVIAFLLLLLLGFWPESSSKSSCIDYDDYSEQPNIQNVLEYCNNNILEKNGQEGKRDLDLVSVHTFIRHGDRFRMHSIDNYQSPPITCTLTKQMAKQFPILKQFYTDIDTFSSSTDVQKLIDLHAGSLPSKEVCEIADLTPKGALQQLYNGKILQEKYRGILDLNSIGDIEVYITVWARTFHSAVAFMYGFLPQKLQQLVLKLPYETRKDYSFCQEQENIDCDCPSISQFLDRMASSYDTFSPKAIKRFNHKVLEEYAETFDVLIANIPKFTHLFDFTALHLCHSLQLPASVSDKNEQHCVNPSTVSALYEALNINGLFWALNETFQKASQLRMYPMLSEVVLRMESILLNEKQPKFVLYSGHDTTIDAMATALKFSTGVWPPYASRVVFELYKKSTQNQTGVDAFVRILYNGIDVTKNVTFCQISSDSTYQLCAFNLFRKFILQDILLQLGQPDYQSACYRKLV